MKELTQIRQELDEVDSELVKLFEQRMQLCRQVAEYKLAHDMPVLDSSREQQVLDSRAEKAADDTLRPYVRRLYVELMALSRAEQQRMLEEAKTSC